jgi:hypothetical protein
MSPWGTFTIPSSSPPTSITQQKMHFGATKVTVALSETVRSGRTGIRARRNPVGNVRQTSPAKLHLTVALRTGSWGHRIGVQAFSGKCGRQQKLMFGMIGCPVECRRMMGFCRRSPRGESK